MRGRFIRIALLAILAGMGGAVGQTVTPAPPTAHPPTKPAAKAGSIPVPAAVKPAPRTPVHSAPLVKPKPGVTGRPAPAHPVVKPVLPVVPVAPSVPPPAPAAADAEKTAEPVKGTNTGLPLPRFATLRSDEVNLRSGPGTRYPIEWVYKRRDLPVQIQREFEVWRLVQDQEGVKGWVHQAVLAPRRAGVVVGGEQVLRRDPRDDADAVARLKPGVIVRLRSCEAASDWCQGGVQDYRGWIKRSAVWGVFPGEAIQ